jgi:hypothetical protein
LVRQRRSKRRTDAGVPVGSKSQSGSTFNKHLDLTFGIQLDIRRFEVAVDHTFLVRGLQRVGQLPRQLQRFVNRNPPPAESLRQVLTQRQLHGEEAHAVVLLQPVDHRNVGVAQRGQQLGLPLEAGQPLGILRKGGRQDLDRDLSGQRLVDRPPDHTHPTLADLLDEAVMRQCLSRLKHQSFAQWGHATFFFDSSTSRTIPRPPGTLTSQRCVARLATVSAHPRGRSLGLDSNVPSTWGSFGWLRN